MKKIGIFYGSTTGTTEQMARDIAGALNLDDSSLHNVAKSAPSDVAPYDVLIFGASTWGDGDLQDDMHDYLDGVSALSLKGKKIALFGCGDENMTDTFCNGVGKMYRALQTTGAEFIGKYNTEQYSFSHSDAVIDGEAVGLLIDNVNHELFTGTRIKDWTDKLKENI